MCVTLYVQISGYSSLDIWYIWTLWEGGDKFVLNVLRNSLGIGSGDKVGMVVIGHLVYVWKWFCLVWVVGVGES